jgi:hypothetical protein
VTSDILNEYFEVINRPIFHLKQGTVDSIIRYIYQYAEFVVPSETIPALEADPKTPCSSRRRLLAVSMPLSAGMHICWS